jgi:ribosomal protein L37AE/L43A
MRLTYRKEEHGGRMRKIEKVHEERSWICPDCYKVNTPRFGKRVSKCGRCNLQVNVEVEYRQVVVSKMYIKSIEPIGKTSMDGDKK